MRRRDEETGEEEQEETIVEGRSCRAELSKQGGN